MDTETAIELLHEMVGMPSPSGAEEKFACRLRAAMADLGFGTRRDNVGNVVGEIGNGHGPAVLLLGHLDTVDRPMPVRREAGRLYGRGAVDAKGALATMVCAAAANPGFPGTLRVAAVVEEETSGSRGAVHLMTTTSVPDVLIVGEPSGWSGVIVGYKGKLDLTYRVRRPPVHSASPLEKASEVAFDFWRSLQELVGGRPDHAAFDRAAATLGGFGGDAVEAGLQVDCRLPPGFDTSRLLAELQTRTRGGELRITQNVPAVLAPPGNCAARSLAAAIRRQGGTPVRKVKTGTSDMNTVATRWDVPMAAYGPGDATLSHGENEHLEIDEFLRALAVLSGAIAELGDEQKAVGT